MLKKHLLAAALLTLLPPSYTTAYPDRGSDLADKTKVAVYFGLGMPSGEDNTYEYYDWKIRKPMERVNIAPNIGLGLVLGHNFIFGKSYKLGPEIGLLYGFTRRIKIPSSYWYSGYTLEERYLEMPIAFLYGGAYHDDDIYLSLGYSLGYQLDFLLSSYCITGSGKTDIKKACPTFPQLVGTYF